MYEIIWLVNCGLVKVENLGLNKPHPGFIPFDWVELDESWVEGDRRGGQMRYLPPPSFALFLQQRCPIDMTHLTPPNQTG